LANTGFWTRFGQQVAKKFIALKIAFATIGFQTLATVKSGCGGLDDVGARS